MGTSYTERRRKAASEAGRPLTRLAIPVATYGVERIVFLAGNDLLVSPVDHRKDNVTWPATLDDLAITGTAYADRKTFLAALKAIGKLDDTYVGRNRTRALLASHSLRWPRAAFTITDSLERKFFLPDTDDETDLLSWLRHFGDDDEPTVTPRSLTTLLVRCLAGDKVDQRGNVAGKASEAASELEGSYVSLLSNYMSDSTTQRAFMLAERADEAAESMVHFDRVGRGEAVATGNVVRATPFRTSGMRVYAHLSSPCRLRNGVVQVLSEPRDTTPNQHGEHAKAKVEIEWDADNGKLVGVFRPMRKNNGYSALDKALRDRSTMLVAADPFLSVPFHSMSAKRWTASDRINDVAPRNVPVDVALAGAIED